MKKISEEVEQLNESQLLEVENTSEQIAELIKNGQIDEGIIKSLIGGLTGATIGASLLRQYRWRTHQLTGIPLALGKLE